MHRLTAVVVVAVLMLAGCSWVEEQPPIPSVYEGGTSGNGGAEGNTMAQRMNITVPEGYTLAKIGMMLEDEGLCTAEEFIDAAQNGDYSNYSLIAELKPNKNRCYTLEGYLFPDTYEIYTTDPPEVIIRKMLDHAEQKIDDSVRARIRESGYSVYEIVTLASIIEKEALGQDEMLRISSVLHNRLNSKWMLECDVTISYVEGAIKPFIEGDKNRYNEYYNTYKCAALPAGPICNPGMEAINAALNPDDTDFFFFVSDDDNVFYYAVTDAEHEANKRAAGMYDRAEKDEPEALEEPAD